MKNSIIREVRHYSGDYLETDFFLYKSDIMNCGRSERLHLTSETQRKLNQRNTERNLTWLIQENFSSNDVLLGFSYPQGLNITPEQAKQELDKYLRRLRYRFKRHGLEFKYISKTEIGKINKRIHHHLICSGDLGRDVLEKQWFNGYTTQSTYLQFYENGMTELAAYICKDNRNEKDRIAYRSYNCSKNLKRPQPQKTDGSISLEKLQKMRREPTNVTMFENMFPGYRFVEADPFYNEYYIDVNGEVNEIELPYITVKMYRKDSQYIKRGRR